MAEGDGCEGFNEKVERAAVLLVVVVVLVEIAVAKLGGKATTDCVVTETWQELKTLKD